MTESKSPIDVVDTSGLTDADWAEINKLRAAYENGGQKALSRALQELATDPIRYIRALWVLFSLIRCAKPSKTKWLQWA